MFDISTPLFWITLAVFFLAIELLGAGALFAIVFSVGAAITALIAIFTNNVFWLILCFILLSIVCVITLKPALGKFLKTSSENRASTVDALIGSEGTVKTEITETSKGYVVVNHEDWVAVSVDGKAIEKNKKVLIEKIEGVTVHVRVLD